MHRLMTNTLPEPILAALGGGDTACVRVYPGTTVLQADMVGFPRLDQDSSMTCPRTPPPQADMVGFTKLSAPHPPQRVLGLLSDIFEASDRPCETRRVEG